MINTTRHTPMESGRISKWQFDGGYVTLNSSGAPTAWNYYVTDHLGSTRKVVDGSNNTKETINYYPYGSEMMMTNPFQLATNSNWQPYRFSGKELDRLFGMNMYQILPSILNRPREILQDQCLVKKTTELQPNNRTYF